MLTFERARVDGCALADKPWRMRNAKTPQKLDGYPIFEVQFNVQSVTQQLLCKYRLAPFFLVVAHARCMRLLVRMVRRAHHGPHRRMAKAHGIGLAFEHGKYIGRRIAQDRQMVL